MTKKLSKTPPPTPKINRRPILMASTALWNWHFLLNPMPIDTIHGYEAPA